MSFDVRGYSSCQLIALCRAVLAGFFLTSIWLDPSQPAHFAYETYLLLAVYFLISILIVALVSKSVWIEGQIVPAAHIFDILVFSVLIYLTEGYTSPFFLFFLFLVLSAAITWGWEMTLITAGVVVILLFTVGLIGYQAAGLPFDLQRFIVRSAYLIVLSAMVIYFDYLTGSSRAGEERRSAGADYVEDNEPKLSALLAQVAVRLRSPTILFIWSDREEPWLQIAQLRSGNLERSTFTPEQFEGQWNTGDAPNIFFFDTQKQRIMYRDRGRNLQHRRDVPIQPELIELYGLHKGMALAVSSDTHSGWLFALNKQHATLDDLELARHVAREFEAALERLALFDAWKLEAHTQARLSLARDIHDNVLQVFAGVGFQLEAIRAAIANGKPATPEIEKLQRSLVEEQQEFRATIRQLERPSGKGYLMQDGDECISKLAASLSSQWGIICRFHPGDDDWEIDSVTGHHISSLIREAVANAVRHGRAHHVDLLVSATEDELKLEINDDGCGFPEQSQPDPADAELLMPRSLSSRVAELHGSIRAGNSTKGARISISLPMELGI